MNAWRNAAALRLRALLTPSAVAILSAWMLSVGTLPRAEVRPLTLIERTGRAPVVVWGEVTDAERRYAIVKTLDLIKCSIPERPGPSFRIAYKLDSFLRQPWQDKITFETGERVLLFLRKFTRDDGDKPEGDLYTLMWGAQGRVTVPPEGERAWVDAVRVFTEILANGDPEKMAAMLRESLVSRNPFIVDAAFEEMLKQGLGTLEMIPELITYFDAAREPTRLGAARLMRQMLTDARTAGRPVPGRQELTDLLRGRAVNDASPDFRVEVVRLLGTLGGEEVMLFLKRLAKEDPSQMVRYEAERVLAGAAVP